MRTLTLALLPLLGFPDSRVDAIFAAYDKPATPGCALGVIRDGALIYQKGYGYANLDYGIPLTSRSVFDIGSTSKQFVGMAAALLEEDGRIRLDDDIRKYFPEIPAYGKPVTVRMMLQHTSGLRDYLTLFRLANYGAEDFYLDDDVVKMIARQRATNFPPGSDWLYSNSGFFLISQLVKRTTGKSLREYAGARILEPLGMKNTHFHDDHTMIVPQRATGYDPAGDGFRINMSTLDMVGDGGIYTTVEDLALWDANFYTKRVNPRAVEAILTPGPATPGGGRYGLGLMLGELRGLRTVRHGGSWAGFRAELLRFPEQRFSVICLCNRGDANPSELADRVAAVYLGDAMSPAPPSEVTAQPIEVPEAALRPLAGSYWEAATDAVWKVRLVNGKLEASGGGRWIPLTPAAAGRFEAIAGGRLLRFRFEGARLTVVAAGAPPQTLERFEPAAPAAAELAKLAGRYRSEELAAEYTLEVKDGALRFTHRNAPAAALEPTRANEFRAGGLYMRFQPERGTFRLNAGRVRGIVFERVK
jgi:CubicO group peptidase (beta-lactamase class C family)